MSNHRKISKRFSKEKPGSLQKYGMSIATVFAVGATIWALFRVGFKLKDEAQRINGNNKK